MSGVVDGGVVVLDIVHAVRRERQVHVVKHWVGDHEDHYVYPGSPFVLDTGHGGWPVLGVKDVAPADSVGPDVLDRCVSHGQSVGGCCG